MTIDFPSLLASHRKFFWTLRTDLSFDYFSFQEEGAGSLLLIGMHLSESMPWLCARNPLYLAKAPGLIDAESKRILGKRFRIDADCSTPSLPQRTLDTLSLVLQTVADTGHCFHTESEVPPMQKTPGKLLPRPLTARAHVALDGMEWTLHARNFSEVSQCLHAELALVFGLSQLLSGLPQRPEKLQTFQLETTLKPCRMCAAFLHVVRKKCRTFSVSYEKDDPGRLAAHTLLDRFGYQSNA
ncbi:Bd3614 family nucleic acid deaminase [Oligoflexus tunisiensis]|uniref:Bd3614 family nucleic acid deaminase n=1 Tax=Oligoflexus tunisiensis TaxID=708132 RepID=UPI00114CC85E|nr:Bd3614 family nucleic acid deaminase [Oligoflexus tunisiensis]